MNRQPPEFLTCHSNCGTNLLSINSHLVKSLLRLDPGEGRIRTGPRIQPPGKAGGEYNVARGLRKCFGLKNRCLHRVRGQRSRPPHRRLHHAGRRSPRISFCGNPMTASAGRPERIEFYRTWFWGSRRGRRAGSRPHRRQPAQTRRFQLGQDFWRTRRALVPYRRAYFAALSESTGGTDRRSRQSRGKTRHDCQLRRLNYRPSPLEKHWREAKSRESQSRVANFVDVMIGNEEDFTASLGFRVKGLDHNLIKSTRDAVQADDTTGSSDSKTSKSPRQRSAPVISATSMIGVAICWMDGNSMKAANIPASKSSTGSVAAIVLPAASSMGFLKTGDPQQSRGLRRRRTARWQ